MGIEEQGRTTPKNSLPKSENHSKSFNDCLLSVTSFSQLFAEMPLLSKIYALKPAHIITEELYLHIL